MNYKLIEWRKSQLIKYNIHSFYYFSFIQNLNSILYHGILPYNVVKSKKIFHKSFAELNVQQRRHNKTIKLTNGKFYQLHDLVPLYLTPLTPTLFARKNFEDDIFFIRIKSFILCDQNIAFAFTDGNAASAETKFYYSLKNLDKLDWNIINSEYWAEFPDGRRRRNAEFLIYPKVDVSKFWDFIVKNNLIKRKIKKIVEDFGLSIDVKVDESYFF